MVGEEKKELYSFNVEKKGGEDILSVNYRGANFVPNLADNPEVMEKTVDLLIENPNVSRIIFEQEKNYNYDFKETNYLLEIASLYVYLTKQEKILSHEKLVTMNEQFFSKRYSELLAFLQYLKKDPFLAHSELKKILIEAKILVNKLDSSSQLDQKNYNAYKAK